MKFISCQLELKTPFGSGDGVMTISLFALLLGGLAVSHARSKVSFSSVIKSLEVFKQQHMHLQVPYSFVVPIDGVADRNTIEGQECPHLWPEECRGVALGAIVSRIRTRGDFTRDDTQRALLAGVGMLLLHEAEAEADAKAVVDVKVRGADDSGTTTSPTASAITPTSVKSPASTAIIMAKSRTRGPYSCAPSANDVRYAHFVAALQHYKSLYGHVDVPAAFIVPIQASTSSHALVAPLSARPTFAGCQTAVGVTTASHLDLHERAHAHAGGDADASAWPRACVGLRLGQVLDGVRRKGNYVRDSAARQLELSRLGVELACVEISAGHRQGLGEGLGQGQGQEQEQGQGQGQQQKKKWQRRRKHNDDELLLALDIFYRRYGHMAVPGSYIVGIPHAPYARRLIDPSAYFPSELQGLRLGTKVAHIRNRGSFPHLHASLTAMGFVWDPRNGCDGYENAEFHAIMDALAMYELTGEVASFES
jgi:hypothetical protein